MTTLPRDFNHNAAVLAADRIQVKKQPVGNTTFTNSNGKIEIELDNSQNYVFDGHRSFANFTASVSGGATTNALNFNINSIMVRVETYYNNRLLERFDEAGLLENLIYATTKSTDFSTSYGALAGGILAIGSRQTNATGARYNMVLPAKSLLRRYIPTYKLNGKLKIVWTIDPDVGKICETTGSVTNLTVTVTNFKFNQDFLVSEELKQYYDTVPFEATYLNYFWYQATIAASGTTASLPITVPKCNSASHIFAVFRDQVDGSGNSLSSSARLNKMWGTGYISGPASSDAISDLNLRIGSRVFPQDHLDLSGSSASESVRELQQVAVHNYLDPGTPWSPDLIDTTYASTNWFLGLDLSAHGNSVSGIDTRSNNADMYLNVTKTAFARLIQVDVYVAYMNILRIGNDGSLSITF